MSVSGKRMWVVLGDMFTIVYHTPLVSKNLVDTWYPSGRIVRLSSQVCVVFPWFSFALVAMSDSVVWSAVFATFSKFWVMIVMSEMSPLMPLMPLM